MEKSAPKYTRNPYGKASNITTPKTGSYILLYINIETVLTKPQGKAALLN